MKHTTSPKDVFLQLFSTAMLYLSLVGTFVSSFILINFLVHDPISNYTVTVARLGDMLSFPLAMLIVAFPVYVWSLITIKKREKAVPSLKESHAKQWLTNLTLFLAAIIITITAITVVFTFFDGELSLRFALKSLMVLILSTLTVLRYKQKTQPSTQLTVKIAALVLVVAVVLTGIVHMGSPQQRRFAKADETTRMNLQQAFYEIESAVNVYDQNRGEYTVEAMPNGIVRDEGVVYSQVSNTVSSLCADFLTTYTDESRAGEHRLIKPDGVGIDLVQPDWSHMPGENCYTIEFSDEELK